MFIKGKIVTIRGIEKEDLSLLLEMINDPEIEEMTVDDHLPLSMAQEIHWFENSDIVKDRFMITTADEGVVGMTGFKDYDWKNRVVRMSGIKMAPGKGKRPGIALDALLAMFSYAFEKLNMNRIEGDYVEFNKGAEVMNKLAGFKVEGRKRKAVYKNGKYWDLIVLGILREEFEEQRKKRK